MYAVIAHGYDPNRDRLPPPPADATACDLYAKECQVFIALDMSLASFVIPLRVPIRQD